MTGVVNLLRREHAQMATLLDLLEGQLAAFKAGERPDYGMVQGILDYFLTYPDLCHHPKEDLVFLRLRRRDRVKAEGIDQFLSGHDELALLARRFARATVDQILNGEPESGLWFASMGREFVDINRRHMAKEEEYFFPLALDTLTAGDWAEISNQISDREDPLFGKQVERRFQSLHDAIMKSRGANCPAR